MGFDILKIDNLSTFFINLMNNIVKFVIYHDKDLGEHYNLYSFDYVLVNYLNHAKVIITNYSSSQTEKSFVKNSLFK